CDFYRRFFVAIPAPRALATENDPRIAEGAVAAPGPATAPQTIEVDASKAVATYSNFCRVTGTPEELIIDFGLNSQPMGVPAQPIAIEQRTVLNFYTAKRLL